MGVNQSWGATSSHRRSGASHTLPSIIRPGLALPSGSGCFRPWEGFPPFPKGPEEPVGRGGGGAQGLRPAEGFLGFPGGPLPSAATWVDKIHFSGPERSPPSPLFIRGVQVS